MTIKKRNDFILATVFLLGSVFFYGQTYEIREVMYFSLGPLVFPRIVLGIMFVLSASMLIQNVEFRRSAEPRAKTDKAPWNAKATWLRLGLIGLLLAYLVTLPYLGYTGTTIAFLFLGMSLLGVRTVKSLAVYAALAVIVTLSLQYLFGHVLKLFLP